MSHLRTAPYDLPFAWLGTNDSERRSCWPTRETSEAIDKCRIRGTRLGVSISILNFVMDVRSTYGGALFGFGKRTVDRPWYQSEIVMIVEAAWTPLEYTREVQDSSSYHRRYHIKTHAGHSDLKLAIRVSVCSYERLGRNKSRTIQD